MRGWKRSQSNFPTAMTVSDADIQRAAAILESGGLVAFPTETVYGLGADAENPDAIRKIYAAKGRPSNHPVIVHIASDAEIGYWAQSIPEQARRLIAAFWPGPLTLILKRAVHIPDTVAGGQDSIGLRCPSHPVAQAVLRTFKQGKGGIAAPSANRFGHVSPTTAQHVRDEFGEGVSSAVDMILDGGQSEVGIESTIVDLSRPDTHGPVLLRPGQIGAAHIANVLGIIPANPDVDAPRASGLLESHYAPRTPVALIDPDRLDDVLHQLALSGKTAAIICCAADTFPGVNARRKLPATPEGYAHELYAALRAMDMVRADVILVESPPNNASWQGINDRLRRAAYDSSGILSRLLAG